MIDSISNDIVINNSEQNDNLQIVIDELENKILVLNAQHNIEVEKLKRRIRVLEDNKCKKVVKLKETKKETSKGKTEIKRLTDAIAELRIDRLISPEDENFLNVI